MEKTIQTQKNQLLKKGVKGHWDPEEDRETFWVNEESSANKQDDHLDDGDMEYINAILNSFSKQNYNLKNSNHLKLKKLHPRRHADTRARANDAARI